MDAVEPPRPSSTSRFRMINNENVLDESDSENMDHPNNICRICLLSNSAMKELFHSDSSKMSLSDKAMGIASVKIFPGDGLPSHICCDCEDKLESAYKFKLEVERSDSLLRKRLNSMNVKEELFLNDVDINLSSHRPDVEDITGENLLLKDHINLLSGQERTKIENESAVQKLNETISDQSEDNYRLKNQNMLNIQELKNEEQMQTDQELDQHNQSFGSHDLQDLMLNEFSDQERMQEELSHAQQLNLHEHDYVAESQVSNKNIAVKLENTSAENNENIDSETMRNQLFMHSNLFDEQPNVTESPRRSKRNLNKKNQKELDSDEENYFENLNLSSRLKKIHSEKVFFMCYLCDKQFLSKEILKEHMYSHEEIRKSLCLKTSELQSDQSTNDVHSGKKSNKCPYCGKEYLYIISFKKHLKQHEREKDADGLPLEVSFQEHDDSIDFSGIPDIQMDSDSEDDKKITIQVQVNKEPSKSWKCNICMEIFDDMEKLRDHRSKHVVEGVMLEQDLNLDAEKIEILSNDSGEEAKADSLKCPHCPMVYAHKKSLMRHMDSHKGVKFNCKLCHQSFTRKDHLRRHLELHENRLNSFKCMQCNKVFGNELTLRNHLIATNHRTLVHGQEYDPNKRIKRSAAKAAQKIIDQIKMDLRSCDGSDDDDEESGATKNSEFSPVKGELVRHGDEQTTAKKVHGTKSFFCTTCNLKCVSKQALAKHIEQHAENYDHVEGENENSIEENSVNNDNENEQEEDDDNYEGGISWPIDSHECPTCKKRYSTKKSLQRHQLLHDEPNFECDICNLKFYRKDKLKAHYDKCSEKNPDQVRKCNICGDVFESNLILRQHRAKHVEEGILTEEDLRELDPRPEDLEKMPRKRRTDITGLECTECNKRYTSRKGLLRHIQVHESKKYLCDMCPKKFYRREHLKVHVAKHNMVKPHKCPRCTKRFMKEEQLNQHLANHDKIYKKSKEANAPKRFLCEICSKKFTQSTTLVAHLRAHNGIKPYVCEVCTRPFTTNAYLKMHMRTHTQERPYICQYCSRAFARADTLANHLTSHTGEAKYQCKYCSKHFRRLKSLKEHVFIHTGQRPYACPTCDRRFNNNGSRYAHSKRCKQNMQGRQTGSQVEDMSKEESQQGDEQLDEQLQETEELEEQMEVQGLQHAMITQAQVLKPQNVKTITIQRPDGSIGQQQIMAHQEVFMPLILPLTVTLADVEEEVILPEGTKIFTT